MTALKGITSLLAFLLLAGCQTDGVSLPSFGCTVFKPITWSKMDTKPTIRQVVGHNAVGVKSCGWKK